MDQTNPPLPPELFREALAKSRDGVYLLTASGHILWANDAAVELSGFSWGELNSKHVFEIDGRDAPPEHWSELMAELRSRGAIYFRADHLRAEGGSFPVDVAASLVTWDDREFIVAVARDTTARDQQSEALRDAERQLDVALRTMSEGVLILDDQGTFLVANNAFCDLTGIEQSAIEGKKPIDPWPVIRPDGSAYPGDELPSWVTLQTRNPIYNDLQGVVRPGGEVCWLSATSVPIFDFDSGTFRGVLVTLRDVTKEHEARQAEAAAQKMERLESIGTLAGGIAHDFNNMLTGVQGNLDLARHRIEHGVGSDGVAGLLHEALDSLQQARRLTSQLLTFSKGGAPRRESVPVAQLVGETASVVRAFPVSFRTRKCPGVDPFVLGDPGQLQQIVANLILNAAQAASSTDGGAVEVSCRRDTLESGAAGVAPGDYIVLQVEDNGPGIPAEVQERIFDPYYSTRHDGRGLGLAIVHSVARAHGGRVEFDSTPGVGTTFRVWLPAAEAVAPKAARAPSVSPDSSYLMNRVLLLDDDEFVRTVAVRMVAHFGGECDTASTAAEAVQMYRDAAERGAPYGLVIMDLTIPGDAGGRGAISEILAFDPDAVCIVSSGYADDPVMSDPGSAGFAGVLTKPYTMAEFREAVEAAAAHTA